MILSIAIPNYNRFEKLKDLLDECIHQIHRNNLESQVQISVSDDFSSEDPSEYIELIRTKNHEIELIYERNDINRGMDFNFLNSVKISRGEFCWIIGNDDIPEKDGIKDAVELLQSMKPDILVTPFNKYGPNGEYRGRVVPYKISGTNEIVFDTRRANLSNMIKGAEHNCAFFTFLSNVIFRRERWINNSERFSDKMNTIFIQMYMNIQMLKEGATYIYADKHIIRNFHDDDINSTIKRKMDILTGLNGVADYFFEGEDREVFKSLVVDPYLEGKLWVEDIDKSYKEKLYDIQSPKNNLYKKYFINESKDIDLLKSKEIVIYGAGALGQQALSILRDYMVNTIVFADSDRNRAGGCIDGISVKWIVEILNSDKKHEFCYVVANHFYLCEMVKYLEENGITQIYIIN